MSLSKFLSTYVFRSIYKKGGSGPNFYLAVMITFFVSGFWHGAGWRFVLWGIINGIFVCIAHFMARKKWKLPFILAWFLTFGGVVATRIIFVSFSIKDALYVYKSMFDFSEFIGMNTLDILLDARKFIVFNLYTIVILIIGMSIAFWGRNTEKITSNFSPKLKYAILSGILLTMSFFQMSNVTKFLYFQF